MTVMSALRASLGLETSPSNLEFSYIENVHRLGLNVDKLLEKYFESRGLRDNKKRVEIAKIVLNAKPVRNNRFFLSIKDEYYVVFDLFNAYRHDNHGVDYKGNGFLVNRDDYELEVTEDGDNILVTDLDTGDSFLLIDNGRLNFRGIKHKGVNNYTFQTADPKRGFKGYPALRFNNSHSDSLRVHAIIFAFWWGIEIACQCIGDKASGREYDIHHVVPFSKSFDNSPDNLRCLRTEDHEELHGRFWEKG